MFCTGATSDYEMPLDHLDEGKIANNSVTACRKGEVFLTHGYFLQKIATAFSGPQKISLRYNDVLTLINSLLVEPSFCSFGRHLEAIIITY